MSEIYDLPLSYQLVRKHIKATFRRFFNKYIVIGKENIPSEGPVIFAPNHLNALMDALGVLTICPDNYSMVYLARADIFKNKKVARILRSMKILPAFRIRDGIENLGRNADVFDECVELLKRHNALCIMPEGNQELERKIRPLVKGIFRIAFSAQQALGSSKSIKIIPVGFEYEDFVKFGKNVIVNIGQPIEVLDYIKTYNENPPVAINEIRNRLKTDLENLTVHLDTKEYYSCFETSVNVANEAMLHKMGLSDNLANRFMARKEIGKKLVQLEKSGDKIITLNQLCSELNTKLKEENLRIENLTRNTGNLGTIAMKCGFYFLTLPVFILGLIFNFLPFQSPVYIRKAMKVKFSGFFSSFHYVLSLLTFPVFYIIQTLAVVSIFSLTWWEGLLFIPAQYFAGKFAFYFWYKKVKKLIFDFKIRKFKKQNPTKFDFLIQLSNRISKIIVD